MSIDGKSAYGSYYFVCVIQCRNETVLYGFRFSKSDNAQGNQQQLRHHQPACHRRVGRAEAETAAARFPSRHPRSPQQAGETSTSTFKRYTNIIMSTIQVIK